MFLLKSSNRLILTKRLCVQAQIRIDPVNSILRFGGVDPAANRNHPTDVISHEDSNSIPTASRQRPNSTPTVTVGSVSMSAETSIPGAVSLERKRSICLPPLLEGGMQMGDWGSQPGVQCAEYLNQGALPLHVGHTWGVEWEIFF